MEIDKGLLRALYTLYGANSLDALVRLKELEEKSKEDD